MWRAEEGSRVNHRVLCANLLLTARKIKTASAALILCHTAGTMVCSQIVTQLQTE